MKMIAIIVSKNSGVFDAAASQRAILACDYTDVSCQPEVQPEVQPEQQAAPSSRLEEFTTTRNEAEKLKARWAAEKKKEVSSHSHWRKSQQRLPQLPAAAGCACGC